METFGYINDVLLSLIRSPPNDNNTSQLQLEFLPYDVLFLIFDEMEIEDILELSMTNKRMNEAVKAYNINKKCYEKILGMIKEKDKKYMYILRKYYSDTDYCSLLKIKARFSQNIRDVKFGQTLLHYILEHLIFTTGGRGITILSDFNIAKIDEEANEIFMDNLNRYVYENLREINEDGLINYIGIFNKRSNIPYFEYRDNEDYQTQDNYLDLVHALVDFDYRKLHRDYPVLKYFEKLEKKQDEMSDKMHIMSMDIIFRLYADILSPLHRGWSYFPASRENDFNKECIFRLKDMYMGINGSEITKKDKKILLKIYRNIMKDDNIPYESKKMLEKLKEL